MHHYRLSRPLDIPCRRNHSIFASNINRRSRYHHHSWSVTTTTWWRFWTVTTAVARGRSHNMMSTAAYAHAVPPQKIALGQVCSTSSKWNNLVHIAQCAGWAASSSCAMLFLPECCGFLGTSAQDTLRNAEPSLAVVTPNPTAVQTTLAQIVRDCGGGGGSAAATNTNPVPTYDDLAMQPPTPECELSIVDGLRIIAQTSQLWISAGSVHVLCPDDGDTTNDPIQRVYNTHIIMDPTGTIRSEYRKIHLFDVCLPQQNVDLRESRTTRPGSELVVCRDSPVGCLGVTVCYDLRFPEMFTQLVQTMGAQVLLVPSAFTVPTGKAHWHTLLRARAIENQCYVIAAAQCGRHNDQRSSYGHSLVVDGWGTVLVDAGGMDQPMSTTTAPTIATCDIDLSTIESIRERMPIQQHRANSHFSTDS